MTNEQLAVLLHQIWRQLNMEISRLDQYMMDTYNVKESECVKHNAMLQGLADSIAAQIQSLTRK